METVQAEVRIEVEFRVATNNTTPGNRTTVETIPKTPENETVPSDPNGDYATTQIDETATEETTETTDSTDIEI